MARCPRGCPCWKQGCRRLFQDVFIRYENGFASKSRRIGWNAPVDFAPSEIKSLRFAFRFAFCVNSR
jgi:hypothetical protein